MRNVAVNVQEEVVPGSGHWLMEENPAYTVSLIRKFLDANRSHEARITPAEVRFPSLGNPGVGRSGVEGIQTVALNGDPNKAGPYTIMLRIPAHTRIAAHFHRGDRIATVVSGNWSLGYGSGPLIVLPAGSFYTEPGGDAHFAATGDEPAVVQITGYGPSSTVHVKEQDDPRRSSPKISQK